MGNRTWQTASDTQWTQALGHPRVGHKVHMNLLLSARQQRQRVRKWHDAFGDRERTCSRLVRACRQPSHVMTFLGLFATMISGVVNADGHMNWPSWLAPLPMVICSVPLIGRLCMSACALLLRCHLWCRTRRARGALLESTPCRAEFDTMAAALHASQSLVIQLHLSRDDVEGLEAPRLAPLDETFDTSWVDVLIVGPWASALLLLLPLPSLLQFAPLFCECIAMALLSNKFYKDLLGRKPPIRTTRVSFVALATSILLLGLHMDWWLRSAVIVAVSFWLFIAVTGIWACFTVHETIDQWPDEIVCIVASCAMCLGIALASASIGVAAVLDKETGGPLAVIPYTVVVFVLFICVPSCCFISSLVWVAVLTLDDD